MLDCFFLFNKNRNFEEDKLELIMLEINGFDFFRFFKDLFEIEYMESLYMKSIVFVFRVLKEIRSGSLIVSVFLLLLLQVSGLEDDLWKMKVGILE